MTEPSTHEEFETLNYRKPCGNRKAHWALRLLVIVCLAQAVVITATLCVMIFSDGLHMLPLAGVGALLSLTFHRILQWQRMESPDVQDAATGKPVRTVAGICSDEAVQEIVVDDEDSAH